MIKETSKRCCGVCEWSIEMDSISDLITCTHPIITNHDTISLYDKSYNACELYRSRRRGIRQVRKL